MRAARREAFFNEIFEVVQVIPFTRETARIAAQIRGVQSSLGNSLPFADSLIAAAALEIQGSLLTLNLKDFTRIPNLQVIPFRLR